MSEEPFIAHRSLLFTVAYEMLGSAADSEDIVQETWLRWDDLGETGRDEVRDPRAYLVRVVTRQALNRLRTLARRREEYVGEWLPEPLLTGTDVADDVELAESISIAMLTVLETLGPAERVVFVLREVFDVPYEEIAETVGKTSAAVRQIAHRAREHIEARRPRMEVSRTEQERVVERFIETLNSGDMDGLMEVLAPDVVLIGDGGGLAQAVRRPLRGSEILVRIFSKFGERAPDAEVSPLEINGSPGAWVGPGAEYATAVSFAIEDGRITRIFAVRNPRKLGRLAEVADLRR